MTKLKKALSTAVLGLVLIVSLAAPALGDEAAVGEGGGGYLPLGDGWATSASIYITVPDYGTSTNPWPLVPDITNPREATTDLTVNSNGIWRVDVKATNGGYMTRWNTTADPDEYDTETNLASQLVLTGDDVLTNVTLTGYDQELMNGTSTGGQAVSKDVDLSQAVSWDDERLVGGDYYKIVITFTGSAT
jgi:hypothetical protein